MGTDLISAFSPMRGIEVSVLVDRRMKSAPHALELAGHGTDAGAICESQAQMDAAFSQGKIALVKDAHLGLSHPNIDIVIEATGRPAAGAEYGLAALENGKHLVMMNIEADVTIGAYLQDYAAKKGLVYTIGAGDEPSAIMELYDFVTALGLPVIAAGKGKNNPFRPDAVPDQYRREAESRNMNPRLLVEFVDGSKTAAEMGCLANATGLTPDCAGMHGPDCSLENLHKVFCPAQEGGILQNRFCVDFTIGENVSPGVFVIAEIRRERMRERLSDLKFGDGPYYTFYRPYHLTSLEVPLSAARAFLYGTSDMKPLARPVAEVCALAKRDLKKDEILDCIGETCYRSWLMRIEEARDAQAVPAGLLEKARVMRDVRKGELITRKNVNVITDNRLYEMRQAQDKMTEAGGDTP